MTRRTKKEAPRTYPGEQLRMDCGVIVDVKGDGGTLEAEVFVSKESPDCIVILTGDAALQRRMARQNAPVQVQTSAQAYGNEPKTVLPPLDLGNRPYTGIGPRPPGLDPERDRQEKELEEVGLKMEELAQDLGAPV